MTASTGKKRIDWQARRDEIERALADGASAGDIAKLVGTDVSNACAGLKRIGLVVPKENRRAAQKRAGGHRPSDEVRAKMRASAQERWARMTPEERSNVHDAAHSRSSVEKRKRTLRRRYEASLRWLPPAFRDDYDNMLRKYVKVAEARSMLEPLIRRWARETFEGQMWLVETGKARLAPNVATPARPADRFELTGRVGL